MKNCRDCPFISENCWLLCYSGADILVQPIDNSSVNMVDFDYLYLDFDD